MQDWISGWKRGSPTERWFAIALAIWCLMIPLGFLIGGGIIGT
jgi:hypothetical protein